MSDLQSTDCGCSSGGGRVSEIYRHLSTAGAPLAMAYVPTQAWGETYELRRGLSAGTIFPDLYKPFCGRGGRCR